MGKQIAVIADKRMMALMVACASFVLLFLIARVAILNAEPGLPELSCQAVSQNAENDEDAVFLETSKFKGDDAPIQHLNCFEKRLLSEQTASDKNIRPALSIVIQQAPSRASPLIS